MPNAKAITALITVIVLIANIFLFAFRIVPVWLFWTIIGVGALITYTMFPKKR